MRARLVRFWHWPEGIWLGLFALVLLIRFPIHFLLYPPYLMDFEVYRSVAVRVVQGGGAILYTPATSDLMMFKYAPCWALAWTPLAWFPTAVGAIVWSTSTVLWVILTCWGAHRICERVGLPLPPWGAFVVAALLSRPLTAEFLNGQVDALWACLTIGFLVASVRQRPWWSSLWLALAISLKLPALLFLAYALLRRHLAIAWRTMLWLLVLNVPASALLNPAQPLQPLQAWLRVLVSSGASRAFEIGNQSLVALAGRLLTEDRYGLNLLSLAPAQAAAVAMGLAAVLFGLIVFIQPTEGSPQYRLVMDGALLTILMVLASPTVWIATYSAFLFPLAVAVALTHHGWRHLLRDPFSWVACGAVWLLSFMTHSSWWRSAGIRAYRGETYVFLVFMILPWFGLALFAYLWRQRQAGWRLAVSAADISDN